MPRGNPEGYLGNPLSADRVRRLAQATAPFVEPSRRGHKTEMRMGPAVQFVPTLAGSMGVPLGHGQPPGPPSRDTPADTSQANMLLQAMLGQDRNQGFAHERQIKEDALRQGLAQNMFNALENRRTAFMNADMPIPEELDAEQESYKQMLMGMLGQQEATPPMQEQEDPLVGMQRMRESMSRQPAEATARVEAQKRQETPLAIQRLRREALRDPALLQIFAELMESSNPPASANEFLRSQRRGREEAAPITPNSQFYRGLTNALRDIGR